MTHYETPHPHRTVGECGECPDCRAYNISRLSDCRFTYLLRFADEETHEMSIAIVADYGDDPMTTAWATGCNPGGHAAAFAVPYEVVERAGVPLFQLIAEPGATAALDALLAAR